MTIMPFYFVPAALDAGGEHIMRLLAGIHNATDSWRVTDDSIFGTGWRIFGGRPMRCMTISVERNLFTWKSNQTLSAPHSDWFFCSA